MKAPGAEQRDTSSEPHLDSAECCGFFPHPLTAKQEVDVAVSKALASDY